MFTARSSKASKLKNNFSASSFRDKHVGKLFSFCQNEKEKIQQMTVVMDRKPILKGLKKNKRENPSSSPWLDIDSNLNPS